MRSFPAYSHSAGRNCQHSTTYLIMSSVEKVVCKRCGKGFASQTSVLNHQNQPTSNCLKQYNAMQQAKQAQASTLAPSVPIPSIPTPSIPLSPPSLSPPPAPSTPGSPMLLANADAEMMEVDIMDDQDQTSETMPKLSEFYTEVYPNAGQTLSEKGQTFLNIFDEDEYAEARMENLYYPFASQQEWELASFLLQSDLSVAAIDRFLRLELVSLHIASKRILC